jgi:hypothetical protein
MKFESFAISAAAAGLLVATSGNATTIPTKIVNFTASKPIKTLQTKATSWRDPAFGDMGWTHNSAWGKFKAKEGQTVTITAESSEPKLHPGISVWFRGADDTAPDKYVADHFYPQNANQVVFGAKDEITGEAVGNIVMKIAAFAYDKDDNVDVPLRGKKDGVSGRLKLVFKAKQTGNYLFVLGGFNPGIGVDPDALTDVTTEVTVTDP